MLIERQPFITEGAEYDAHILTLSNVLVEIAPDLVAREFSVGASWTHLVLVRYHMASKPLSSSYDPFSDVRARNAEASCYMIGRNSDCAGGLTFADEHDIWRSPYILRSTYSDIYTPATYTRKDR